MKTGRNDPCPCGSGKKYKNCCLTPASVANDEFKNLIAGQDFNSLEELQAVANNFMQQRNQQPHDDFQGLSSEQVHRMLHFPFDTPEFFDFSETLRTEPEAPILTLIQWIANATDEKGLKATAKGNLPQKLCKEAFVDYQKQLPENDFHHHMKINREDDFDDLHATRIILELAGLLRKTKGRFFLTKKYQQLVEKKELAGLYPAVFKTCCSKFNWAYRDGYDDIPFIQQSFLFSMYLGMSPAPHRGAFSAFSALILMVIMVWQLDLISSEFLTEDWAVAWAATGAWVLVGVLTLVLFLAVGILIDKQVNESREAALKLLTSTAELNADEYPNHCIDYEAWCRTGATVANYQRQVATMGRKPVIYGQWDLALEELRGSINNSDVTDNLEHVENTKVFLVNLLERMELEDKSR